MPPTGVPIPVHVNFKGISYDSATGQWTIPSGAPDWSVPATVAVASGNNLLTWTLTTSHLPAGFTPVFDPSAGIVFDADWPGGSPTMVNNTTIEATDDFPQGSNSDEYYYSVTVDLQQTNGTVTKSFTLDPDIQNQGANPVIRYVMKSAAVV
jgi:hypothetical protein